MSTSSHGVSLPVLLERLEQVYPEPRYELNWETPLQLLVGAILAAQCTDERVNQVTPALFARYPDAKAFAAADLTELETLLPGISSNRKKASAIKSICQTLVDRCGGQV